MKDPRATLQELGSEAARGLDAFDAERALALEEARRSFLSESPARRMYGLRFVPLAFAAALAVLAFLVLTRTKPALSFRVDSLAGRASEQISAQDAPVQVSFSDGTVLTLAVATRARVLNLEEHGANIALESGVLDASVVHTGNSAWSLVAGPLTVRVTGTRFTVRWEPERQHFSIHVTQGSVAVAGSLVGAERPVRSGETLQVSLKDQRLELTNDVRTIDAPTTPAQALRAAEPAPSSQTPAVDSAVSAPVGAEVGARSPASTSAVGSSAWRTLALQGKMRDAYASADAMGFDHACESASAADLLLLGDAARLAGRSDRVNEALLQLRRRFPNDPRRAAAAFMLGKVAFDRGGADRSAANWFATSLREQPRGSLAREAAGRLIEALNRSGDASSARKAAEDYLNRYPEGPHAALAHSLLR